VSWTKNSRPLRFIRVRRRSRRRRSMRARMPHASRSWHLWGRCGKTARQATEWLRPSTWCSSASTRSSCARVTSWQESVPARRRSSSSRATARAWNSRNFDTPPSTHSTRRQGSMPASRSSRPVSGAPWNGSPSRQRRLCLRLALRRKHHHRRPAGEDGRIGS